MSQVSNREQLLRGAILCLQSNGYARTTARDIATASGANLASIGYHFGSKEELLNEALMQAFTQWTEQLGQLTLATGDTSPLQRLARAWEAMLEAYDAHRALLVAFVEAMAQTERSPRLREQMAAHYESLRAAVGVLVAQSASDGPEPASAQARALASLLVALCDGFALQWLLDPSHVPDMQPLLTSMENLLTR